MDCQNMGVETDFMRLLPVLMVRQSDWRKLPKVELKVAYKDFAHSSKVAATTKAVKEQYPDRTLVACLELHTYSSLNAEFLKEYEGALEYADVAIVFYSPDAVKIQSNWKKLLMNKLRMLLTEKI
jgi:UDP-N-acetylmuramate: L-alanyl-gamma-D-glutamyl-meso-diaminopimelate ligase